MTWWQTALLIWFALQLPAGILVGQLLKSRSLPGDETNSVGSRVESESRPPFVRRRYG